MKDSVAYNPPEAFLTGSSHDDAIKRAIRVEQIPEGQFGLPELLDRRRIQYCIPNAVFETQCAFERVLVWQLDNNETEFFKGSEHIYMPKRCRDAARDAVPRGVLVGAGLSALDSLRSNGIDLGHIVNFISQAPFRLPIDIIEGSEQVCVMLRAGEITASEDLAELRRQGKIKIESKTENNEQGDPVRYHVFVDENGNVWDPTMPWTRDDM